MVFALSFFCSSSSSCFCLVIYSISRSRTFICFSMMEVDLGFTLITQEFSENWDATLKLLSLLLLSLRELIPTMIAYTSSTFKAELVKEQRASSLTSYSTFIFFFLQRHLFICILKRYHTYGSILNLAIAISIAE